MNYWTIWINNNDKWFYIFWKRCINSKKYPHFTGSLYLRLFWQKVDIHLWKLYFSAKPGSTKPAWKLKGKICNLSGGFFVCKFCSSILDMTSLKVSGLYPNIARRVADDEHSDRVSVLFGRQKKRSVLLSLSVRPELMFVRRWIPAA